MKAKKDTFRKLQLKNILIYICTVLGTTRCKPLDKYKRGDNAFEEIFFSEVCRH